MAQGRRRRGKIAGSEARVPGASPGHLGVITWESAIQAFVMECEVQGRSPYTVRLHQDNLRGMIRDLKNLGVSSGPGEVTTSDLKSAILHMSDAGRAQRTINIRRQTMRSFFGFLREAGMRADDPAAALPKRKEARKHPKALLDAEVRALLDQPDKTTFSGLRDYVLMLVLLDTGMRLGELQDLTMRDIDLNRGVIHLTETKDCEDRHVFLLPATLKWLQRYLRERRDCPLETVFISRDDTPLNRNTIQGRLRRYGLEAGITRVSVSPHTLRHTFARMYILSGGDPFSLKDILGHSTMEMVYRYVDLWGQDIRAQHRKFSPINSLGIATPPPGGTPYEPRNRRRGKESA